MSKRQRLRLVVFILGVMCFIIADQNRDVVEWYSFLFLALLIGVSAIEFVRSDDEEANE